MSALHRFTAAALIAAQITALLVPAPLAAQGRDRAQRAGEIGGHDNDIVINVSTDDTVMNAAIAEARRTLPEFLAVVEGGDPAITEVSFKFPLEGKERIWVSDVTRDGDYLTGRLANHPLLEGYRFGQPVRVKLSDVIDWGYRGADRVMRGHRTTRVFLLGADPATRRAIFAEFGWK